MVYFQPNPHRQTIGVYRFNPRGGELLRILDFIPCNSTYCRMQFTFEPLSSTTEYYYYAGNNSTGTAWFTFENQPTNQGFAYWNIGSSTIKGKAVLSANTKYDCDIIYNNGSFNATVGSYTYSTTYSGNLGADYLRFFGADGSFAYMKLYNLKLYSATNSLSHDLIPAKNDLNGAICMYDKMTRKFYYNMGSGEFKAGAETGGIIYDISPKYSPVEYIEATGAAYLNTGYIPLANDIFEIKAKLVSNTAATYYYSALFGSRQNIDNEFYNAYVFFERFRGNQFCYNRTGDETIMSAEAIYDKVITITTDGASITWADGTNTYNGTAVGIPNDCVNPLFIFAINQSSTPGGASVDVATFATARLYSFIVKRNGEIIHDYIPIAKITTYVEYGLYDKINDIYITNPFLTSKMVPDGNDLKWRWDKYSTTSQTYPTVAYLNGLTIAQTRYYADSATSISMNISDSYSAKCTAYGYLTEDKTVDLLFSTDDGGTLTVNDVQLGTCVSCSTATYSATLKKGWNKIEVCYCEGSGGDGWYVNYNGARIAASGLFTYFTSQLKPVISSEEVLINYNY